MDTCPACKGKGTYSDMHYWSDGWGMVECTCPLCDGTGKLVMDLMTMALKYKAEAAEHGSALRSLRTHIYLYLKTSENPGVTLEPEETPRSASGPSSYPSTWLDYLKKAAAMVPLFGADAPSYFGDLYALRKAWRKEEADARKAKRQPDYDKCKREAAEANAK